MLRRSSSIIGKEFVTLALAAVLASLLLAGPALAAGGGVSPVRSANILGMVPARGAVQPDAPFLGSGNLSYHGGLVELTNKVYAIYWIPPGYTVSANYTSLINRFFSDVAADSGKTTNVYYSDTQYYDGGGHIQYKSSLGGSAIDTHSLPTSGCTDKYTKVCLTDAQLQTEIKNQISAHGWTANSSTEFFMFTAKGIGSCAGGSCAFSSYCAYHSWIGSGSTAKLYANMPYADTVPSACDAGQHPNHDDADATINVTSHEHNETITDEQGNAWYDAAGYENGDKCAWIFGAGSGTSPYKDNETIHGDHYWLQEEWSNYTTKCVLTNK